jgi:hypothetical protein
MAFFVGIDSFGGAGVLPILIGIIAHEVKKLFKCMDGFFCVDFTPLFGVLNHT